MWNALGGVRALGVAVDAPEHEGGVAEVEVGEPLDQGFVERVALEAGLERAAEVGLVEVAEPPRRLPRALEALVGVIDVGLLGGQFGVLLRHSVVCERAAKRGPCNSIGTCDCVRPPVASRRRHVDRSVVARRSSPRRTAGRGAHAGVVHAPGRAQPARVPGRPGRRARSSTPSSPPDLAAEITLQPVRRYGVDAAVLFSDIVVPAHAVGFGIDVAPGTGPVAAEPLRAPRRPAPAATAASPTTSRYVAETVRDRRRRARPGRAGAGLRRRPVHRGQLPDRGPPEPHLRAHQGARCTPTRRCGTT